MKNNKIKRLLRWLKKEKVLKLETKNDLDKINDKISRDDLKNFEMIQGGAKNSPSDTVEQQWPIPTHK